MIKGITQNGRYMIVSGGSPSSTYYQNGQPMSGMTRFYNNNLEVYDGNMWQQIGNSYATVGLTPEAESLLDWAREKRNEELEMKLLALKHPAVDIAYANLKKAEQQLQTTIILSKEHENNAEAAS